MSFPLPIPDPLRESIPPGAGVLVAASGGVDSSVAAAVLAAMGCRVVAVTFKNFCYGGDGAAGDRSCCSLDAIDLARRAAAACGARHFVTDVAAEFRAGVVDPFVAEYEAGRTPNPCVTCNAVVRFPHLVRLADTMGLEFVATGHYARVERGVEGAVLRRGLDLEKDQAYFLHGIGRQALARTVFPLGWYGKDEVRRAAAALDLPTAARPESQEICFVPDDDRTFLFADGAAAGGEIVDTAGNVLGRHRGLPHYTVGQRRGLGVAGGEPLYVVALDVGANRVVLGGADALDVRGIRCDRFTPMVAGLPDAGPDDRAVTARIRHRHRGAAVTSWRRDGDSLAVRLAAAERGVAPGQFLVLYDDDLVLGGGRIVATD